MKIGIYTIHTPYNYGAMLQAYATQKALEKLGYEAELVNFYTSEEEKVNESKILSWRFKSFLDFLYARVNCKIYKRHRKFKEFHSKMKLSKRYYSLDEIYDHPPEYGVHLVGSDQVWNIENGLPQRDFYFLDFLKSGEIKMSYASSFGTSKIDKTYYESLKMLLSTFKVISVREDDGVNIVKNATGLVPKQVMDPTFLLNTQEWSKLFASKPIIKGEYIFCYGFDKSEKSYAMISAIRERLKLPVIAVLVSRSFRIKVDRYMREAGPEEFLNLAKYAAFICTGSYHGAAFAIHLRKSFFVTIHPTKNSRMETLLKRIGLENRQLRDVNKILQMSDDELFIDYANFEDRIYDTACDSMRWLKENLQNLEFNKNS